MKRGFFNVSSKQQTPPARRSAQRRFKRFVLPPRVNVWVKGHKKDPDPKIRVNQGEYAT